MTELSLMFWLFVGAPILTAGGIGLLFIWINEIRFKREMREILEQHRGWD